MSIDSRRKGLVAGAAAAWILAAPVAAAPLEATSLYTEKARNCRTLDLATWSHPTRKVMQRARVEIHKVELCNADIFPIFTVALPAEPLVGVNDRFFNKLYAKMSEANGWHSFAFVDPVRGVIVTVDVKARRSIETNYDEFDIP